MFWSSYHKNECHHITSELLSPLCAATEQQQQGVQKAEMFQEACSVHILSTFLILLISFALHSLTGGSKLVINVNIGAKGSLYA